MKRTIVYHNNETLANRAYKPRPEETVAYRAKADFDELFNATFDQVVDLSDTDQSVKPKKVKENVV